MILMESETIVKKIVHKELGQFKEVKKLGNTKNEAYYVLLENCEEYIVKIFCNENMISKNTEFIIYEHLKDRDFLKSVKVICKWSEEYKCSYIITEYIQGETLLEKINNKSFTDEELKVYVHHIKEYLSYCSQIKTTNFGNLDENLNGMCSSWTKQLKGFLAYSKEKLLEQDTITSDVQVLLNANQEILNVLEEERVYFENVTPVLTPIDLNMSNFLVSTQGRFIVLDVDAFWSGDYLLAIGELVAHIYGTKIFSYFLEEFEEVYRDKSSKIHFYSLVSSYSVLFFIWSNTGSIRDAKPWGNEIKYIELLNTHIMHIKQPNIYSIIPNLLKNKCFCKEWGIKLGYLNDRSVDTSTTLERIEGYLELAGITRVTDITRLDSTGITAFQSIRPDAEIDTDTFTVFSGKGITSEQCKVSAIVEAIERFSAEKANYSKAIIKDSYRGLSQKGDVIHPGQFNVPSSVNFREDEQLEWVEGENLLQQSVNYITANCVFYPYTPSVGRTLSRYFTTGLSAGNSYLEAVAHGLAEVIERDAAAINFVVRHNKTVSLESIKCKEVVNIIEKIKNSKSNLNMIIRYISAPDIDIPVFSVIIEDLDYKDPLYVSGGYGAHPNKNIALINALNEAALSRVSTISGAREDLEKFRKSKDNMSYEEFKEKYQYWFECTDLISYDEIQSYEFPTIIEDIGIMVQQLTEAGFKDIIMVDLKTKQIDLPIIKMLVPGMERYSFKMTCIGNRLKRFYNIYHKKYCK